MARRDFLTWIEGAKQSETRSRRIKKACDILPAGKRRPCCYSVVPMGLYRALGNNVKAKAQWRKLTPVERRDFIDWLETVKDPKLHAARIGKIIARVIAGKRHP